MGSGCLPQIWNILHTTTRYDKQIFLHVTMLLYSFTVCVAAHLASFFVVFPISPVLLHFLFYSVVFDPQAAQISELVYLLDAVLTQRQR